MSTSSNASYDQFAALHQGARPLMLANAWDAASTVLLQQDGAPAIATSSSAMAWALGYADGSFMPRAELIGAVRRIMRVARVPISIDIEDGYCPDHEPVADLVAELVALGIAGVNLEDGAQPMALMVEKIWAIRRALGSTPLFINARTDVFLKGLAKGDAAIAMAAYRVNEYEKAGASGAFVPGMATVEQVSALVPQINLPLNLMVVPSLAPVAQLFAAGVRRFSAGGSLFQTTYGFARAQAARFHAEGDISGLFAHPLPYPAMNQAMKDSAAGRD
jgi:2-methylisocitrate lyase-like PEP mutase family enzyme